MRMSATSSTMRDRAREALRLADADPHRSAMLATATASAGAWPRDSGEITRARAEATGPRRGAQRKR
jgi:hypothetical protein